MGYHRLNLVPGYYQGTEAALRMRRDLASGPAVDDRNGDDPFDPPVKP
jgi:hypothetical protein